MRISYCVLTFKLRESSCEPGFRLGARWRIASRVVHGTGASTELERSSNRSFLEEYTLLCDQTSEGIELASI